METLRFAVGGIARIVVYACMVFIVGNAVYGSIQAHDWFSAIVEAGAFPATFVLHPFLASAHAVAWPFADGTSFIPALVGAFVAYPVSTFVGGFAPIDY